MHFRCWTTRFALLISSPFLPRFRILSLTISTECFILLSNIWIISGSFPVEDFSSWERQCFVFIALGMPVEFGLCPYHYKCWFLSFVFWWQHTLSWVAVPRCAQMFSLWLNCFWSLLYTGGPDSCWGTRVVCTQGLSHSPLHDCSTPQQPWLPDPQASTALPPKVLLLLFALQCPT